MNVLDTLILKIASRCNLACTYCYEYFAGDDTWKTVPKFISITTLRRLGERIQEYGAASGALHINVVLHGGEPLIVGPKRLDSFLTCLTESSAPVRLRYSVQTNGVLINRDICEILRKHDVLIGISLDGGVDSNARRITPKGEPTLAAVSENIQFLKRQAPRLFAGILCVVNLDADPIETLASLCAYEPPEIDLLYPFVTHDHLQSDKKTTATKFGRWMVTAMNYWMAHPKFSGIKIRFFEDALQATISRRPKTDWFGARTVSYLVVETGGKYDLLDQLKVIGRESHIYRGLDRGVYDSSICEAIAVATDLLKKSGADVLPTDCIGCKWSDVCAGGHLPARHSARRAFNNRSVYCEGIQDLLEAAHRAMMEYKGAVAQPQA